MAPGDLPKLKMIHREEAVMMLWSFDLGRRGSLTSVLASNGLAQKEQTRSQVSWSFYVHFSTVLHSAIRISSNLAPGWKLFLLKIYLLSKRHNFFLGHLIKWSLRSIRERVYPCVCVCPNFKSRALGTLIKIFNIRECRALIYQVKERNVRKSVGTWDMYASKDLCQIESVRQILCVCVCVVREREQERESKREKERKRDGGRKKEKERPCHLNVFIHYFQAQSWFTIGD